MSYCSLLINYQAKWVRLKNLFAITAVLWTHTAFIKTKCITLVLDNHKLSVITTLINNKKIFDSPHAGMVRQYKSSSAKTGNILVVSTTG